MKRRVHQHVECVASGETVSAPDERDVAIPSFLAGRTDPERLKDRGQPLGVVIKHECARDSWHADARLRYALPVRIRKRVPSNRRDSLLSANRHTCCVCRQPRHPVEIHHINGDPSDNTWNNLAVICRNCHGLVTAKGNLGGNYTPGEVLYYKREWETYCAEADADQVEAPLEEIHETKLIEGGEHEIYPFEMEKGEELVFSIDASDPLDTAVCDEQDAET